MYALFESSFAVLLSVLALILMLFVLTAGATDGARVVAWIGVALTPILTLLAHGQLIGSFRRKAGAAPSQPGGLAIPLFVTLVFASSVVLVGIVGSSPWASFARTYATYALAPPTFLALVSRVLLVRAIRRVGIAAGS